MKKQNIIFGLIVGTLMFALAGMASAGTFTLNNPVSGIYSNNGTIWINITWYDGTNPAAVNSTNITLIATNLTGSWAKNQSQAYLGAGNTNSVNLTTTKFQYPLGTDRTLTFGFQVHNSSGALLESSANYTYIYDATALTLTVTPTTAGSTATISFTPTDAVAASNCTDSEDTFYSVTSGTEYTYTKTYGEQGKYSLTTTCKDRAGNSVSTTSSDFDIYFGGSSTVYTTTGGQVVVTDSIGVTTIASSGEVVVPGQQKYSPKAIMVGVILGLVVLVILIKKK